MEGFTGDGGTEEAVEGGRTAAGQPTPPSHAQGTPPEGGGNPAASPLLPRTDGGSARGRGAAVEERRMGGAKGRGRGRAHASPAPLRRPSSAAHAQVATALGPETAREGGWRGGGVEARGSGWWPHRPPWSPQASAQCERRSASNAASRPFGLWPCPRVLSSAAASSPVSAPQLRPLVCRCSLADPQLTRCPPLHYSALSALRSSGQGAADAALAAHSLVSLTEPNSAHRQPP